MSACVGLKRCVSGMEQRRLQMGTEVQIKWVMLLTPNIKIPSVDLHSLVLKNRTNFQDFFCNIMGKLTSSFLVSSFNMKVKILKWFTFRSWDSE